MSRAEFDAYAASYDADLARGLSLTGESKAYYARRRLEILRARLDRLGVRPGRLLDFGCGIGDTAPLHLRYLGVSAVVGVDPSEASIERARADFSAPNVTFHPAAEYRPDGSFDLAFVNGVFHHIPIAERETAVALVRRSLRPGGLFAFWENNPWNPGTRLIMRRVAFDREAIMLSPPAARRLLRSGGFTPLSTDHAFFFPRMLAWLRRLEPSLARLPFGGQYLVLGRAE
jgi:SAM-dependent methyltransferase